MAATAVAAAALAAAGACRSATDLDSAVATIEVVPATSTLGVGSALPLQATLRDADGRVINGRHVVWTTNNPDVAAVSDAGVVTGKRVGTAQVAASSQGKSAIAAISVVPTPVATVSVIPNNAQMAVGATVQLVAATYDAAGSLLSGRAVVWSSGNQGVATVDGSGRVTAVALGAATISATSEGRVGSATISVNRVPVASVTVTPSPTTVFIARSTQLTATARDASGNVLTDRAFAWSSNNETVATVSQSGLVTGRAPGQAVITATSEGRSGTAQIMVSALPVSAVTVTPTSVTLSAVDTRQLSATPRDDQGNPLPGRPVTWSTSDPAVAIVSQTGMVSAEAPGTVAIRATSEGTTGSASITVQPAPVDRVIVSPTTVTLEDGEQRQLTAALLDSRGRTLTGRAITWASADQSIATVDATGRVRARKEGVVTVTATAEGKTGSSKITVTDDD